MKRHYKPDRRKTGPNRDYAKISGVTLALQEIPNLMILQSRRATGISCLSMRAMTNAYYINFLAGDVRKIKAVTDLTMIG